MTIVKRRGKWGVKVYERGTQRWVGTFDTFKGAKRAERDAMDAQRDAGETCASLAQRWPSEAAQLRGWRESTPRQYEQMLRPFVAMFGESDLEGVDRQAAKRFARQYPASVRFAQAMFADALKDGLVSSNPFLGLRPPRGHGRRDITALSEQELRELADTALEVHFDSAPRSGR